MGVEFLLQRRMLGIKDFDLLVKDRKFIKKHVSKFVGKSTQDKIILPSKDYWKISKLYRRPVRSFPSYKFRKAYGLLLNPEADEKVHLPKDFPWRAVVPETVYKKEVKKTIEKLFDDYEKFDLGYYFKTYKRHEIVFSSLKRAAIDPLLYEKFIKESGNVSSRAALKTFVPVLPHKGKQYAEKISYDRFSSVTGRLTVKSGPSILHLRKDYRKIITSKWGADGSVYYLDFSGLEPRILLSLKNDVLKTPRDIYLHVANEVGIGEKVNRKTIKTAIISMIYGSNDEEIAKKISDQVDYPEEFVSAVKEHFGVEELKERLKKEYERHNGEFIYNLYGRPIFAESTAPYVLVNYFLQSSAVDVALHGFSNIIERLSKADGFRLIRPLFVLHDALILDVHKSKQHLLPKMAKAGAVKIPKFENTNFWISIEQLS